MPTKIPYLDEVWSVTSGCTPVSLGCLNCYAAAYARRGIGDWNAVVGGEDPRQREFSDVAWHTGRLNKPLHWRKPRVIGVSFLGDLFHEQVPSDFLDKVFSVIAKAKQHTFLVLTKRPEAMLQYLNGCQRGAWETGCAFPWPNLWLGVTVCTPNERWKIDRLCETPAAHHWVSFEPLLDDLGTLDLREIDLVILGGESGPKARPMEVAWARSVKDQCQAAGVDFYYKQGPGPDGKLIAHPTLDGREWRQLPWR